MVTTNHRPLVTDTDHGLMLDDFNGTLPKPNMHWGATTFGQRLEGHPAMKALGAVRGTHPRNRKSGFKGVQFD